MTNQVDTIMINQRVFTMMHHHSTIIIRKLDNIFIGMLQIQLMY